MAGNVRVIFPERIARGRLDGVYLVAQQNVENAMSQIIDAGCGSQES